MNALDISRWIWDFYLAASVLLAAALLVGMWVCQPARRMALAWATVGGLLALMLLTMIPSWSRIALLPPAPPEPAWADKLEPDLGPAIQQTPFAAAEPSAPQVTSEGVVTTAATPIVVIDWGILTSGALLIGSGIVVVWLLVGAWQVRRLRARAEAVPQEVADLLTDLALQQRVELGMLAELPVPVAVGLRSPCILLPRTLATSASREQLRSVLAHELAHIEHRDLWLLSAMRFLMIVLWPHPLFWLLRRQIRRDQEVLADTAAAALSSRADYAEQLVALARSALETRVPRLASSVGLWEGRSQLTARIKLLLDEQLTILQSCSRRWRVGAMFALGTLAVGLSLVTLAPQQAKSLTTTNVAEEPAKTVSDERFAELVVQSETTDGFANAVGELVAAAIRPSHLPYVSEKRLAAISYDFVMHVNKFAPANLTRERKAELLAGLRDHAQQHLQLPSKPITEIGDQGKYYLNGYYLDFPNRIKTLKWELWMALTREPLDGAAIAKLESQRDWMRGTIAEQPGHRHYTHEQVLRDLEVKFADPLCVVLDRPMSDEAFAKFQAAINDWLDGVPDPNSTETEADARRTATESQLPHMVHHFMWETMRASYHEADEHPKFQAFDGDSVGGNGVGGGFIELHFVSNSAHEGPYLLHLDGKSVAGGIVDADTGFFAHPGLSGKGDFVFEPADSRLVARNGAKLLSLDVANWMEADWVSVEELREKLAASGADEVDLAAFVAKRREEFAEDFRHGRVESPFKGMQSLEEALRLWDAMQHEEGPFMAVLTDEGNVAVVHITQLHGEKPDRIAVRTRVRPRLADTQGSRDRFFLRPAQLSAKNGPRLSFPNSAAEERSLRRRSV